MQYYASRAVVLVFSSFLALGACVAPDDTEDSPGGDRADEKGQSTDQEPELSSLQRYFPMEVGRVEYWRDAFEHRFQRRMIDLRKLGGREAFVVDNDGQEYFYAMDHDNDDLYSWAGLSGPWKLEYDFPPEDGKTSSSDAEGEPTAKWRQVGDMETIHGSYIDCWKSIEIESSPASYTAFCADEGVVQHGVGETITLLRMQVKFEETNEQ